MIYIVLSRATLIVSTRVVISCLYDAFSNKDKIFLLIIIYINNSYICAAVKPILMKVRDAAVKLNTNAKLINTIMQS